VHHCLQNGVLILNAGTYDNIIRLLMPLTISDEEFKQALQVLEDGLTAVAAELGQLAGAAH
jgi:4-aminobutyrate aminotransferase/(S)-3-amino-2-methylpropionate transaminase